MSRKWDKLREQLANKPQIKGGLLTFIVRVVDFFLSWFSIHTSVLHFSGGYGICWSLHGVSSGFCSISGSSFSSRFSTFCSWSLGISRLFSSSGLFSRRWICGFYFFSVHLDFKLFRKFLIMLKLLSIYHF